MNLAIATTTVNVPTLLREFRAMRDDVLFVVAGDEKTPHGKLEALSHELGNMYYIHPQTQDKLGYSCAAHIPANSIQKRNLAILEAVRQGADIIWVWDDDNASDTPLHFKVIEDAFDGPCERLRWHNAASTSAPGWLNYGWFGTPEYTVRGFPLSQRHAPFDYRETEATVDIGVLQSLVLGDPDIDAVERIAKQPNIDGYRMHGRVIFTIDPKETWMPINSQSTAWRRELTPLMLVPPGLGRFDDIWGGFLAQRILMATDYHVGFGWPFVRQNRNGHDLIRDLEQEIHGMRYTEEFVAALMAAPIRESASVLDNLDIIVETLAKAPAHLNLPMPFLRAWVEDVGRLL